MRTWRVYLLRCGQVYIGLSPDWELRLGLSSLAVLSSEGSENVIGLEDTAVGFKLRLRV